MSEDIVDQLKFSIECERRNGTPEDCGLMEALVGAATEIERLRCIIENVRLATGDSELDFEEDVNDPASPASV